jgi:hypothetical protein
LRDNFIKERHKPDDILIMTTEPTTNPAESSFPLHGLRKLRDLRHLLTKLNKVADHPNRKLHYDDFVLWLLLAYYNPVLTSLRALQRAGESPTFRERTELPRFALGSFSEAAHAFDPEPLRRIVLELAARTTPAQVAAAPSGLPADWRVWAADGSVWKLLPRLARAFYEEPLTRCRKGERKGHFLFDVLRGLPEDVLCAAGSTDDRRLLPLQLRPHVLYVLDRGYWSVALYEAIVQAEASFVARSCANGQWTKVAELPVDEAGRAVGVQGDWRISWRGRELRLVEAKRFVPPSANLHPRRKNGKHRAAERGVAGEQVWYLLTDRFDLSAAEVVQVYAYRWSIELFFRWLKCVLGCRHMFSESAEGFAFQIYAALLATLLLVHYTGCKPCKALLEVLTLYLQGWAGAEDVARVAKKCLAAEEAKKKK